MSNVLANWYKDRDFPEVKASNSDIVAIIENPKQLQRVIREHNELLSKLAEAEERAERYREALRKIAKPESIVTDGSESREEYEELYDFWHWKSAEKLNIANEALTAAPASQPSRMEKLEARHEKLIQAMQAIIKGGSYCTPSEIVRHCVLALDEDAADSEKGEKRTC